MRGWMLAGLVVLGTGWVGCEERFAEPPAAPPAPSDATVEPGETPQMGEVQKLESERRELYEDVAEDVGVEAGPEERRAQVPGGEPAVGGSGPAGQEAWRGCGVTVEEDANAQVVAGELTRSARDSLTIEVASGEELRLFTDPSTCVLQAGRPIPPESLREGTSVRASYVIEGGVPTARLIRTQPARPGR